MAASRPVSMAAAEDLLRRIFNAIASPPWLNKTNNALQVQLTASTASAGYVILSSGTVTTLTNQSQMGGVPVSGMHNNQVAWAECVRRVIT